ncbi:MAG: hypothetical protein RLZZ573_1864 [Pseudomonadota bacterium]|jgi:toxin CcdB
MARFDVYPNPDVQERDLIPFFLDVQSDHVQGLETRVVVPMWKSSLLVARANDLNPEFEVGGQRMVMDTPALAAVPISALRKPIHNLSSQQLPIQNALDILFGAY